MTRRFLTIPCGHDRLAASLDPAPGTTALLIISGGNEIRSGAHRGMARLAGRIADEGFPVLRYDRRGIGESTGDNGGFLESKPDMAAAAAFFRQEQPQIQRIIAFGICDAATALALYGPDAGIDGYILANPWIIEPVADANPDEPTLSPAAVRSRYWDRIRNPRTIIDLLSGRIDLKKLLKGLQLASRGEESSELSLRLRDALPALAGRSHILLAQRDTTARAFLAAWNSADFAALRASAAVRIDTLDSASHSFADETACQWLTDRILESLRAG